MEVSLQPAPELGWEGGAGGKLDEAEWDPYPQPHQVWAKVSPGGFFGASAFGELEFSMICSLNEYF